MKALENSRSNPIFLRHDLMIELGRLEMSMEDANNHPSANDQRQVEPLQVKIARINEALESLSKGAD